MVECAECRCYILFQIIGQQASEQNERGVGDIVNKTSSATLVSEQMINVANSNKESVEKLMKIIEQFTEEKQV